MTAHSKTRRDDLLAYIIDYRIETGCSPTVREMVAATGLASTSAVWHHLIILEKDGRLRRCGHANVHWLPVTS